MIELINSTDFEMLLRILLAALLGLTLGLERELKRKALGLKTILVISVVSSLLTIVSIQSAYTLNDTDEILIRMDPLRLAAQIVSGVGFLGAGVILRRNDETISGLTTAAVVWGAAGIGIATGAGFYVEAVVGVLLLLFSVEFVPFMIRKIGFSQLYLEEATIHLRLENRSYIDEIIERVKEEVIEIEHFQIKDLPDENCQLVLTIMIEDKKKMYEVYKKMVAIDFVFEVDLQA